ASGSIVSSGGSMLVSSGGTIAALAIAGGIAEVKSGGIISGPFSFTGSGTLRIDASRVPSNVISGFTPGDIIDLAEASFVSGGSVTLLSGNVLQVVMNGTTYDLQFDPGQSFAGEQFHLSSDGSGGTDITVTGAVVGSGQALNVSTGQTHNA